MTTRKRHMPWLQYEPVRYDIRRLVDGARTIAHLNIERDRRAAILMASNDPTDQELGRRLHEVDDGVPLPMGHCPINSHLFQAWGASKILRALADFDDVVMITTFDRNDECHPSELMGVNWPRLNAKFRARLGASIGRSATVITAGEVDYSDKNRLFRPHHHSFVAGYRRWSLDRLRLWYPEKGAIEIDKLPTLKERATAISYALKNIAYLHPFEQQGPERCNFRLHPREFRQHMRYLSKHDFRDFLFCMNHRLSN